MAERMLRLRSGLAAALQLRGFDTSDAEGRARERSRRATWSALSSLGARGVSTVAGLITVPLMVNYLGTERYGLLMTISSVVGMLAFADFGMGNGLINAIAHAYGQDNTDLARRYVSSALYMLLVVALILGGAFLLVYPSVTWGGVFNVSSPQAVMEAGPALAVFIGCFVLNLPLTVALRVNMGYQDGYLNGIWLAVGSLVSLAGLLGGIALRAELPWLVLAVAGGPTIGALGAWVSLFWRKRPGLRPQMSKVRLDIVVKLFRLGMLFFLLDIAVAVAYSSDNIVAARVLGPEAVTQYSVPMKLFSLAPMVMATFLMPLWPAYGEAIARGDIAWVKRTLARSLTRVAVITGAVSAVLVAGGRPLIHLWVGPQIESPFMLLLGLAVWAVIGTAGNAVAMFLNGAHVVRFQVYWAGLMTAAAIVAKILLAYEVGTVGIIWGTVLAYVVFMAVPYAFFVPRFLASLERGHARGLMS